MVAVTFSAWLLGGSGATSAGAVWEPMGRTVREVSGRHVGCGCGATTEVGIAAGLSRAVSGSS
jgi:hypothetical protein